MTNYTQLQPNEREQIYVLLQLNFKQNKIAEILKRNPSTISRELSRNKTMLDIRFNNNPNKKMDKNNYHYLPDRAQVKYLERRKESKQQPILKTIALFKFVVKSLKKGDSPELISGRAKLLNIGSISHECIYQFIYSKKGKELKLSECLPRAHKKRKKKGGRKGKRHLIPNRIDISQRPAIIETREEIGHWEGDSIVGVGKGAALHTQVERKTRLFKIRKIERKTAENTAEAMISIFSVIPEKLRKSSTEDNGSEFTKWETVSNELGIDIYFAQPYHSWERGSNEKANGLVRRFFPKRTNFDDVTDEEIQAVEDWINNRPMKCLDFRTPNEAYNTELITLHNS